jgi:hypothetical protein
MATGQNLTVLVGQEVNMSDCGNYPQMYVTNFRNEKLITSYCTNYIQLTNNG